MTSDYFDVEDILADSIKTIWLLCRYTRGSQRKGSPGPLMIRLVIDENIQVSWMPVYIEPEMSAKSVFAVIAGILNGDSNTHAVLFLFDSQYGKNTLYPTWMMMVFTRNGIGPVAIATLKSCFDLNDNGPTVIGNFHLKRNIDLIEGYLNSIDEEIVSSGKSPPEAGFLISHGGFKLDKDVGPEYFESLLDDNKEPEWN